MRTIHWRDLLVAAVKTGDTERIDCLVAQLADAARAREILRAKGYGRTGMTASASAALVPVAHQR